MSTPPHVSSPGVAVRDLIAARLKGVGRAEWLGWAPFIASALSFALFVRVTLYGRVGLMEAGSKGLLVPAVALAFLLLWLAAAMRLVGRVPHVGVSFVPMLVTLPVVLGVLGSESYAREYWIDRSLKVELLLGIPVLVLVLQGGLALWIRRQVTWRCAGPVLAVLAVGFAMRVAGMGWGLPFAFQPEEASIYLRLAMEVSLGGHWNPNYFQNPSLLFYLFGLEFMGVFALSRVLQFGQDPSELYMMFRGEQELFYGLARLNSVVLGTATLLVVYLIGRRLWNGRVGLAAAAMLAVNFLHVRNSQYAVNDVPSTLLLVLSFYYAVRIAEEGRWSHYLLAGLMAGLAPSTKYNAGMVVVVVAVAHWVLHGRLAKVMRPRPVAKLALSAAAAVAGFVVGTPYSVFYFSGFRKGFMEQVEMGQAGWSGQSAVGTGWQFLSGVVHGAGIVVAVLALVGAVLLMRRDRRWAALLLSFPVCYFLFMASMELFFVRWVVPVMPFVALLAAYGLHETVGRLPIERRRALGVGLLILALAQPALYSFRLDWLAHQIDTRQEANGWAERNIPMGSKVAVEAFSILDQESLSFRATLQQREIELVWRATMHDLDWYRQQGFDYLAVSSFNYDRFSLQPDQYADRVDFYHRLDRDNPLVATFSPRRDGGTPPFALDDLDTPFWHLFSYDRPGPMVKVYGLR